MFSLNCLTCALAVAGLASAQSLSLPTFPSGTPPGPPPSGVAKGSGGPFPSGSSPSGLPSGAAHPSGRPFGGINAQNEESQRLFPSGGFPSGGFPSGGFPSGVAKGTGGGMPFPSGAEPTGAFPSGIGFPDPNNAQQSGVPSHPFPSGGAPSGVAKGTGFRPSDAFSGLPSGTPPATPSDDTQGSEPSGFAKRQQFSSAPSGAPPAGVPPSGFPSGAPLSGHGPTGTPPAGTLSGVYPSGTAPGGFGKAHQSGVVIPSGAPPGPVPTGPKPTGPPPGAPPGPVPSGNAAPSGFITKRRA